MDLKEGDDLSNHEEAMHRMRVLLQQLQLTEDVYMSFFEEALLQRVTVHKAKRQWHFHIEIENILPYELFQLMQTRLKAAFSHIASVSMEFTTRKPTVSEKLVLDYWLPTIEMIDEKVIGFLKKELEARGIDYKMMILPDHPTPISIKTHVSDPIPYIIYDSTAEKDSGVTYSEKNAQSTGIYIEKGYTLMNKFLGK